MHALLKCHVGCHSQTFYTIKNRATLETRNNKD